MVLNDHITTYYSRWNNWKPDLFCTLTNQSEVSQCVSNNRYVYKPPANKFIEYKCCAEGCTDSENLIVYKNVSRVIWLLLTGPLQSGAKESHTSRYTHNSGRNGVSTVLEMRLSVVTWSYTKKLHPAFCGCHIIYIKNWPWRSDSSNTGR